MEVPTETEFGDFLSEKRKQSSITLRQLAYRIGVSASYLSDVERNCEKPLTKVRIDQVAKELNLTDGDKITLYNLAGKGRNTIPPDISEYIIPRAYVTKAIRVASEIEAGEEEWTKFITELKGGMNNVRKRENTA